MQALVIKADGTAALDDITADLESLQTIVGGFIEAVDVRTGWHAYCNEEGKLQGLPVNEPATGLARSLGWRAADVLCGAVVFLGGTEDGDEAPVQQGVIDEARRLGILASA